MLKHHEHADNARVWHNGILWQANDIKSQDVEADPGQSQALGCWEREKETGPGRTRWAGAYSYSHLFSIRVCTLWTSSRAIWRMCCMSWRSAISVREEHKEYNYSIDWCLRIPRWRLNQFKNSFIPSAIMLLNNIMWGYVFMNFFLFLLLYVLHDVVVVFLSLRQISLRDNKAYLSRTLTWPNADGLKLKNVCLVFL